MRSVRKVAQPWFVFLLFITASHQILERIMLINVPLADNYLDPLLLMPILLHLLLWEQRLLFKRSELFVFSWLQTIMIFLVVSFVTEYLFPIWQPQFTADFFDVLCYGLGTLFFYIYLNVPYRKEV